MFCVCVFIIFIAVQCCRVFHCDSHKIDKSHVNIRIRIQLEWLDVAVLPCLMPVACGFAIPITTSIIAIFIRAVSNQKSCTHLVCVCASSACIFVFCGRAFSRLILVFFPTLFDSGFPWLWLPNAPKFVSEVCAAWVHIAQQNERARRDGSKSDDEKSLKLRSMQSNRRAN